MSVYFQTAPLEAFVIYHKWYRKLAARGVSQSVVATVPYTAQAYLVMATLAQDDLPGRRRVSLCDLIEQENSLYT